MLCMYPANTYCPTWYQVTGLPGQAMYFSPLGMSSQGEPGRKPRPLHHRAVKAKEKGSTDRENNMRLNKATAVGAPRLPNGLLSGSQFRVLSLPDMPTLTEAESNDSPPG